MRRLLGLLCVLAFAAVPPGAGAQTVAVRPAGDLSSLVGLAFDVPLVADWSARADRLGSFALTLRWDAAVLRYDGGTPGSFGSVQTNADSAAQGVLKVAGANPAGVTGMITLAINRFTPLSATTTTVTLSVEDLFSAVDFAAVAGAAQNGLFCPARGRWGDADLDGSIDSRDALIALSQSVGLDVSAYPERGLADVDGDGTVKARDALIILSHAVGLDVSTFRVLRIAVGSCGSDLTTTYAVTPSGDTVVGGHAQEIQFQLRATAGGAVRTLPDVSWRSSDPAVLSILPDGRGVAAGAGSVVVTGKSGERDSATATIVVVGRRSKHVVDALAVSAANRLGSTAHPYATLGEASSVAAEGDTMIVRPGRYADAATFAVGVVILGQTGGAAGVVLAGQDFFFNAPLSFTGGARAEVHNVTADRVAIGIAALGVDTLVVDSLRYVEGSGLCGDYGIATGDIWRLEVRRSDLRGGGQNSGCARGIGVTGSARLLLVEDIEASDLGDDAIFAPSVDSAVVRRSRIHDNTGYAVHVGAQLVEGGGEVPVPTSTALVVEDSRFLRNQYYGGVSANDLRGGIVTRTVIESFDADGLYLNGAPGSGNRFRIVADTIRGFENYWLTAYGVDSLTVDSTVVLATQDGYAEAFTHVRVTRSRFDGVLSGTALYLNGTSPAATRVDIDSITIRGDAGCSRCAEGLDTYGAVASVNRFTGDNLDYALSFADSAATVTNSTVTNSYYGVYGYGPTFGVAAAPALTVRGVAMTDVLYGIEADYMALLADNVNLARGDYGIQTYAGTIAPSGPDTVRNSTIADYTYSLYLNDSIQVVSGNTLLRPAYYGMQIYGYGTPNDSTIVESNTITCGAAGATNAQAIYGYNSNYRIAGNIVSGCQYGVNIVGSGIPSLTATVRGNTFSVPPQSFGTSVQVGYPNRAIVVGNDIQSAGPTGAIYMAGYNFGKVPYARIDSNTIRGARDHAIWIDYTDTVHVWGNLIDTVVTSGIYSGGAIGIALMGATDGSALIGRNTVRGVAGRAINVDHLGAALAAVDSNGISGSDSAAVWVDNGRVSMRGNNIRNNPGYGVAIPSCCGPHEIHGNAFKGNGLYAASSTGDATVNADSNWWGADGQPPGVPGLTDSTINVFDSAPLAVDPTPLLPSLSRPVPVLARYMTPVAATGPLVPAPQAAPSAAPAAPSEVSRVVEQRVLPAAPQLAARRAARAALPASLAGLRARGDAARAVQAAAVQAREAERVRQVRARLEAEAARKAARRTP